MCLAGSFYDGVCDARCHRGGKCLVGIPREGLGGRVNGGDEVGRAVPHASSGREVTFGVKQSWPAC